MDTYHTDIRLQLLAQGHPILPNRGKLPGLAGWNAPDYAAKQLTSTAKGSAAARVARWPSRFPDAVSTGMRIEEGRGVVDVDVDDGALVAGLWAWLEANLPEVAAKAPARYGGGTHKVALFVRVEGAPFGRIASRRFGGHMIEIFGGKALRSGNCARQFGVYGAHSFNEDGSIARSYEWADGLTPMDSGVGDWPAITETQAYAIIDAFEEAAIGAGLTAEAQPQGNAAAAVYDITEETRFDTNCGGDGLTYAELAEAHEAFGDQLRCSAAFMPERGDSGNRERCWVFYSQRHECVAVFVYGDEQTHYPKEMASATENTEAIAELLREGMERDGVEPPPGTPNWRERYENGSPRASLHNAMLAIGAGGFVCSHDTFHNKLFIGRSAAASPRRALPRFCGEVTDHRVASLRGWISDNYGRDFTEKHVRDAVVRLAIENPFNPIVDMLAEAEANWDGVARLDRMAVDHFKTADTPYHRQCVAKTMVAAVARARNPGCKFDTILVMESPEGWNKSTAWLVLAGGQENFSDESILGKASREAMEQLAGVWIHENAELAGLRKADIDVVRAYASRAEDRARPAYGHFMVRQPRQSIEVGTTNSTEYLQAQNGNRRFWPIALRAPIDLARLRAERLQLWGEAARRQSQGETLTLDPELWPIAAQEQEDRRVRDPWEALIMAMTVRSGAGPTAGVYIGGGIIDRIGDELRVTTAHIFENVLGLERAGHWEIRHSRRLADVMRVLGWQAKVFKSEGKAARGYAKAA